MVVAETEGRQAEVGHEIEAGEEKQGELQEADEEVDEHLAREVEGVGAGHGQEAGKAARFAFADHVPGQRDDDEEDGKHAPGRHVVLRSVRQQIGGGGGAGVGLLDRDPAFRLHL